MSIIQSVTTSFVPVHREGWRFIAIFAAITLLFFWFGFQPIGWLGIVLTLWCTYFFRDPERVTPLADGLVISPADGRVSAIENVIPPPELDLPREMMTRISIFMNVFDVHVNRSPIAARITKLTYVPGLFVNAELDKASEDNERQALTLQTADGTQLGVVQIAGLIARRIVFAKSVGDTVGRGERVGLIKFGSRVDVLMETSAVPQVKVGDRVRGGASVLAIDSGLGALVGSAAVEVGARR